MKTPGLIFSLLAFAACVASVFAAPVEFPTGGRALDSSFHHLGRETLEGQLWPEVSNKPDKERLKISFDAQPNPTEWTLAIRQRDVTERTLLLVNGKEIARLKHNVEPDIFFYPVPPGALNDGENIVAINPTKPRDNMVVGPIHLHPQTVRDVVGFIPVTVTVTDAATARPVPARLTILDAKGNLAEVFNAESSHTAVRLGIVYTMGTAATMELPPGQYTFLATRGMEWSRGEAKLSIPPSSSNENKDGQTPVRVSLLIRREVDTTGFIAADTHLHTLTHSGHGDSNLEERVITLAGDGVELAIATDHNHNTDYKPHQEKLGLNPFFTAVTGNEVSSAIGHINAFPLDANDSPPSHRLEDWVQLVDGIRAKGAKVVILNHPRGQVFTRYAFTPMGLNRASGEFAKSSSFPFDAMELTNPGGAYDPIYLLRDWFALLNHGEKVTAVSASDTHTVGNPAGWWRSYVPSATDDPARIDVDDACRRFVAGETSIAMGIFTDIRVDGTYKMGQVHSPRKKSVEVRLRVAAPSWVTPRRALLFLNGQEAGEQALPETKTGPTDVWLDFSVPLPQHDAYLVAAVIGDGVDHPSVGVKGKNTRFTLAATNPVYLDVDGNGKYESPREQAQALLSRAGTTPDAQWKAILAADEVIAVQMVSLLRQQTDSALRPALDGRIRQAAAHHPLIAEYARYALPMETTDSTDGR